MSTLIFTMSDPVTKLGIAVHDDSDPRLALVAWAILHCFRTGDPYPTGRVDEVVRIGREEAEHFGRLPKKKQKGRPPKRPKLYEVP